MQHGLTSKLAGIGAVVGGAFAVGELAKAADSFSDLKSRVGLAVGSMDEANGTMVELNKIANQTYSSLGNVSETFIQNNQALKDMGKSTSDAINYTESLSNALIVSGAKGDRAGAVIKALSDSMAVGKLSGDGLNTVLKDGDAISQALAKEMGVTVSQLKKLGSEGKITSNIIVNTILKNQDKWREDAESMPATFADAATAFSNMILNIAGSFDSITGVGASFTGVVKSMSDAVSNWAIGGGMQSVITGVGTALKGLAAAIASIALGKVVSQFAAFTTASRAAGMAQTFMTAQFVAGASVSRAAAVANGVLAASIGALRTAYLMLGGPVGLITAGISLFTLGIMKAKQSAKELRDEIDAMPQRVQDADKAWTEFNKNRTIENAKAAKAAAEELLKSQEATLKTAKDNFDKESFAKNQFGNMAYMNNVDTSAIDAANEKLKEAQAAVDETNAKIKELGAVINEQDSTGSAKLMTDEQAKILDTLNQQNAAKELQLSLDAVAAKYGSESREYAVAEAAAKRDAAIAAAEKAKADAGGRAEVVAAADAAIDLANRTFEAETAAGSLLDRLFGVSDATYNAADASWTFNDGMSAVYNTLLGIAGILNQLGAGIGNVNKAKQLALIKSGVEPAKAKIQVERDAKIAEQDNKMKDAWASGNYGEYARLGVERGQLVQGYNLDDEIDAATSSYRSNNRGGGSGGGRGRGGSGKLSDEERDLKRVTEAWKEKNDQLTLAQEKLGKTAEQQEFLTLKNEFGLAVTDQEILQYVEKNKQLQEMKEHYDEMQGYITQFQERLCIGICQRNYQWWKFP